MNNDVEIPAVKTSECQTSCYPLQGMDLVYINPTEPVTLEDWQGMPDFTGIIE
jgi:hypothetical protein